MSEQFTSRAAEILRKAGRGPGYPALSLEEAVTRLGQIRDANLARATASPLAIYKVWGWSSESGPARAALAALNHYDLMEYVGRGENKQVRLTALAHRIIFDKMPNSKERVEALQQAALAPTYHKKLWDKYQSELPPDFAIETFLVRDCKFADAGAKSLIREYRATLGYAGLLKPANMPETIGAGMKEGAGDQEIEVGDLVQVEIDGSLALEKPTRVRAIQEHEGRRWVFIETSETGIPMDQVTMVEKGPGENKPAPTLPKLPLKPVAMAEIAPSEKEWIRGPLSREVSYRLIVSGEPGPKEIGKLIKVLKAQQVILSDEEEEEASES